MGIYRKEAQASSKSVVRRSKLVNGIQSPDVLISILVVDIILYSFL
jgi:hypothetical protein